MLPEDRTMRYAVTLAVGAICILCEPTRSSAAEPGRDKPLLLANYYAWYHKGKHPRRPWSGWTRPEARRNALALAARRAGQPPLSSAAYPLVGLYDSADPAIAGWHVKLAQAAGIDAFLVDWWDTHNGWDTNVEKGIFAAARKHGFKVALLDERAQYHVEGATDAPSRGIRFPISKEATKR